MEAKEEGVRVPNLVNKLYEHTRKTMKTFPCHSNRASQIGRDCERQLVYWRTRWEEANPITVDLELIFREGNIQERAVKMALAEAGIDVLEEQTEVVWREYNITGHLDGVLNVNGTGVLLEIKSMADTIWRTVARDGPRAYLWMEVEEAFQTKPWLRAYYAQMQVYLLCKEYEHGIILCKNKSTGALCQINIDIDYEFAESLVQRAERINAHVAAETLPDRIPWGEDTCGRCEFLHICWPERVGKDPIQFVEDGTAEAVLDRRGEAEEAGKIFSDTHDWIKRWVWAKYPDNAQLTIGKWLIEKNTGKGGRRQTKIRAVAGIENE
jgi:CRISPR/Cas system-associated exonuclease Cas4 (RecB family)